MNNVVRFYLRNQSETSDCADKSFSTLQRDLDGIKTAIEAGALREAPSPLLHRLVGDTNSKPID